MAVQRVIGGVQVENDLPGWPVVRLEEEIDEQGLNLSIAAGSWLIFL
jgi:hypothetical protein